MGSRLISAMKKTPFNLWKPALNLRASNILKWEHRVNSPFFLPKIRKTRAPDVFKASYCESSRYERARMLNWLTTRDIAAYLSKLSTLAIAPGLPDERYSL